MNAHRQDVLLDLRAELLRAARHLGMDVSSLPLDLAAELEAWVEAAPIHGDPEAEAAHAADVRAWQRDRGV